MIVSTGVGAGRQYGEYSWVIFKIILKSEENKNDAWESGGLTVMVKEKYVISVYLRCMKMKSPSGKSSECKQITRPESLVTACLYF